MAAAYFFVPSVYATASVELLLAHDGRNPAAPNTVTMTLSNSADHDVFLLDQNSAFAKPDGRTTSNWFNIKDAFGRTVSYKGRYVVMGPPAASEFTRIRPGANVEASVDLSREYVLPIAGSVSVSTSVAIYDRLPGIDSNGEMENVPYESIESNVVSLAVVHVASGGFDTSSIITCSPTQENATRQAIAAAQSITEETLSFLTSLYYNDPVNPEDHVPPRSHMKPHRRYQNWFGVWDDNAPQWPEPGAFDTDNVRVDQTMFATHVRLLSGATTACDQCNGYPPSSRAWAEGKLIHLCPVNFSDPIIGGITSQAGTIAHEVSHQNDEMGQGTGDLEGVTSRATAHALPRSSAVVSAANYEYFITNAPLGRKAGDALQVGRPVPLPFGGAEQAGGERRLPAD
jgi:Lysine-specific metallo-endopeptidase